MQARKWLIGLGLSLAANAWAANVKIENAWARATAPGQPVGGVFMTLTADADLSLVSANSPVAGSVELHSMVMDKDMMVMRRLDQIALPKGRAVQLAPGGLHIMLFGLKAPLKAGTAVPLALTTRDAKGRRETIEVSAEVREAGGSMPMHQHH